MRHHDGRSVPECQIAGLDAVRYGWNVPEFIWGMSDHINKAQNQELRGGRPTTAAPARVRPNCCRSCTAEAGWCGDCRCGGWTESSRHLKQSLQCLLGRGGAADAPAQSWGLLSERINKAGTQHRPHVKKPPTLPLCDERIESDVWCLTEVAIILWWT